MKTLTIFLISIAVSLAIKAQQSWTISLNDKIVLKSNEPYEDANQVKIKSKDWNKNGWFRIDLTEDAQNGWPHKLQITDGNSVVLYEKDSVSTGFQMTSQDLRKLVKGSKTIKFYIIINPPNPMMGAPSRMNHLCTIKIMK